MSRFIGPRLKIVHRLGELPGLTVKKSKSKDTSGQYGKKKKKKLYNLRLQEKQKLRYHYGLTESQLLNTVRKARNSQGSTGDVLLQSLEMRLDCILFRLGLAPTIRAARQIVNHGHILVNKQRVNIPSYQCKMTDTLEIKDSKAARNLWNSSSFDFRQEIGVLKTILKSQKNNEISVKVNPRLILEYYSRKI